MSDKENRIKVTDRRMFTADGELRQEFRDLGKAKSAADGEKEKAPEPVASAPASTAGGERAPSPSPGPMPASPPSGPISPKPDPAAEEPEEELASGAAFQDLIALLGQTASVYLRQASQQLNQRAEHLEMARLHIDLLTVLKRKTRGNLKQDEQAMLEDAIYQLRMAFVEMGG